MGDSKKHWEEVYKNKRFTQVSWFQEQDNIDLKLLKANCQQRPVKIFEVGCGATLLLDDLVTIENLEVFAIDISKNALNQAKQRLGEKSTKVHFIEGNILDIELNKKFNIWHDRAVFHFLVNERDQSCYINQLNKYLDSYGKLIIATFAEDGPLKCSGQKVCRYSKEEMISRIGDNFKLISFERHTHITPMGTEQKFNYWVFEKDN